MFGSTTPLGVFRRVLTALVLTSVEAFLAVFCVFIGVPILVRPGALAPDSAIWLFPGWTIYVWAAGLTIGGILSLLGIAFSEYRIERIGVLSLGTTVGAFSFAMVGSLPKSFIPFMLFVFFTLAMAARYWVLGRTIAIQQMRLNYIREQRHGSKH